MREPLRIGIIGTGGISERHIGGLLETGRASITALCDPKPENRAARKSGHAELAEAAEFDDYRDMLAAGGLDGAVIASPHTVHAEQIVACLEDGLHVLTEKPMTVSVDEAVRVMDAEKKAGKIVLVGFQRHYSQRYGYIKKVVEAGELGKLEYIQALQCQEWRLIVQHYTPWRGDPALSGYGQLSDSGSHLLDILLWSTGQRPETVWALWDNCGLDVDVNSSIMFRTEAGVLGSIAIVGDAPSYRENVSIVGATGAIYLEGDALYHKVSVQEKKRKISDEPVPWFLPGGGNNPDANFVSAILDGAPVASSSRDALGTAALTEAVAESASAGGQAVQVKWPAV